MVLSVGMTMTGCKKYLNVNSDPNRATDATVTPELLFTQAENSVGFRQASGDFTFLDEWIGYLALNGTFAPQQDIISYNIDQSFGNTLFLNNFNVLFDLELAKQKGLAAGDSVLSGAAMVLSAKLWQETIDLYGNLPYTQAFQQAKYPTPAYDNAQDIYKALQAKLDSAIIYLGTTAPKAFTAADIMNHGDLNKWVLFANTIKLRLLIRQSQVQGFDPTADMAKIVAKGGVLMAGQSVAVNPGYSNDVNKQSPFYENNGWDPTGVLANTSTNANNYIVSLYQNTDDPRLASFFYPVGFTGSTYTGDVFGDLQANIPTGTNSSYFGPILVGGVTGGNTHVGDGTGAKQDQWIMPSYESMFFWAEAVARGWAPNTTDAATAYNNALKEAFVWLGVADTTGAQAAVNAYITENPTIADFTTIAGASADDKARFIAFQKYLSIVAIDPVEAFTDQNRLHFLTDNSYISLSASRISDVIPVRLLYPTSEATSNAANLAKQGTINLFSSKLFWEP